MIGYMMLCSRTLVAAGGLLLVASALRGQEPSVVPGRWLVSVSAGVSRGTSTEGVESAMRAGGWDDTDPGGCLVFCSPSRTYPFSDVHGAVRQLMLARNLSRVLQLRAVVSDANLGTTTGFKQREGLAFGDYLEVQQRVSTLAVLAGGRALREIVWLAAGPAMHRVELRRVDQIGAGRERDAALRVGGLLAAGADVPLSYPLVVQLQGQYRLAGTAELGPIRERRLDDQPPREMPRSAIDFNHAVVLLGLGLRF